MIRILYINNKIHTFIIITYIKHTIINSNTADSYNSNTNTNSNIFVKIALAYSNY